MNRCLHDRRFCELAAAVNPALSTGIETRARSLAQALAAKRKLDVVKAHARKHGLKVESLHDDGGNLGLICGSTRLDLCGGASDITLMAALVAKTIALADECSR